MISEPRLPPALAQFTSGGRREPGDEANRAGYQAIVYECIEPQAGYATGLSIKGQ